MGAISGKFQREVFSAVRDMVERIGGECQLNTGSAHGHARIIISVGGKQRWTPLSSSPRNPADAVRYKLADVKRILRELAA